MEDDVRMLPLHHPAHGPLVPDVDEGQGVVVEQSPTGEP